MTTEVERVREFVRDMKQRLKVHAKRWDKAYERTNINMNRYTYDDDTLNYAFKTLLEVAKVMDRTEKISCRTDKGATKR